MKEWRERTVEDGGSSCDDWHAQFSYGKTGSCSISFSISVYGDKDYNGDDIDNGDDINDCNKENNSDNNSFSNSFT